MEHQARACGSSSGRACHRLYGLNSPLFSSIVISASVFALIMGTGCSSSGDNQAAGTSPSTPPVSTPVGSGVFTYHNDNARTGQNLNETILTPANVNSTTFGLLVSIPLDGQIYAQPLYAGGVNIAGALHNVVFVATQHDSVYAFDADAKSSTPLWQVSFLSAGVTPVPAADTSSDDIAPEVGITSTPVIDPNTGTLYVVAKTKEVVGGATNYVQRLHALDVSTGAEKFGGPVVIQASLPGTGGGNDGHGNVIFDALRENQRTGLLLSNGVIYIAWASHSDFPPYHGWVLGYNAATLQQVMAFNDTINGGFGGIWQSGGGLSADAAGNIYFVTGNGTFDANTGGANYGDTVVKLSPSGKVLDYFTPFDQADLAANDKDLGSTPALLLPTQGGAHPNVLVIGGKNGTVYSIDRDVMGGFKPTDNGQIVQSLPGIFNQGIFGAPVYFNNSVYFSPWAMPVQSFALNNGLLTATPTSQSPGTAYNGFPGGTLAISANGSTNGILWTIEPAIPNTDPAILHAYDATNLAHELYNSNQAGARDQPDVRTKFAVPTVINGKVYVGTNTKFSIYGLL